MTNQIGQNQTVVRDNNIKLVLKTLQKKDMSCSDIAKEIHLSKPALTKITAQMEELDLIRESDFSEESDVRSLGRKKTYLSINENAGVVAGIDFSTVNIKIEIANLKGKRIDSRELVDFEFIDVKALDVVKSMLNDMLMSQGIRDRELLCLCIGASGKIDKDSGEIVTSKKLYQYKDINLKEYFEKAFDVKVLVKNDVSLSLFADISKTIIKDRYLNSALLYVDVGVGGAMVINGSMVYGAHGYAGEFGLMETAQDGQTKKFADVMSINALKAQVTEYQNEKGIKVLGDNFRYGDIVEAFYQDNKYIVDIVLESARKTGELINQLIDILDFGLIVIAGRIKNLGTRYLQEVKNSVSKDITDLELEYSASEDSGVAEGAVLSAVDEAFSILISRRKFDF